MSREEGFAIADISTSLLDDPKFRQLWRRLGDDAVMDRALTLYLAVVLESWRDGERAAALDVVPMWQRDVEGALEALCTVGLLDESGRIPGQAWASWFEPAAERRETLRDRWRRDKQVQRASAPRAPRRNDEAATGSLSGIPDVSARTPRGVLRPVPSLPSVLPVSDARPREADAFMGVVDYIEKRTGRPFQYRAGSNVWSTLTADVRDFGDIRVLAEMAKIEAERPDINQLVYGATNALHPIQSAARVRPPTPAQREQAEAKAAVARALAQGSVSE